jgi:hypothetical protein
MISNKSLHQSLPRLACKIGLQLLYLGLFAMLAGSPALAQTCSVIGNTITCDDGLSGQLTGNFTTGVTARHRSASATPPISAMDVPAGASATRSCALDPTAACFSRERFGKRSS